ncbi:AmmeMemoRadiSam system radical SAM enzyme [Candidatus Woesearchaeota archaeon]|nr:AmmeMemoRadiSam system radical SAM enzyme [Candidatus Woesearchaeota archaeon]
MKEAMFYEKKKDKIVQCHLCPHNCVIAEGKTGNCRVRKNSKGKLYSLVYGNPCTTYVDPIEKKPLYHFMPGTNIFSIATVGCNLHCKHCQNWEISQTGPEDSSMKLPPEEVVAMAVESGCQSIAYTYTEPTIFYEYVYDIARIAKQKGLKNVMVTNGYINPEPLKKLYPLIDAANVDLKGFTEKFYREVCGATLQPVLETLKALSEMPNVWLEATNLIIPTKNDDPKKIKEMCEWIKENLGVDVPLHFSRFFPYYKLTDLPPTPADILFKARKIALDVGMHYVYIGNLFVDKEDNTYCPKCGKLMVGRSGFGIVSNNIRKGKCGCGHKIAGVW